MTGWLIFFGIVLLIAVFPVGISARYDASGAEAKLILGPVKLRLYPRPKKKAEEKPADKPKPEPEPGVPEGPPPGAPTKDLNAHKKGGSLKDFIPLVRVGLDLLGSLRRKLRVNDLRLRLTLAGGDPCDLAVNYGRAQAAGAALMARLEQLFVIKKRDVQLQCDFEADATVVLARLDLTITVGRLLSLGLVYGIRGLRTYLKIKEQREGGAIK